MKHQKNLSTVLLSYSIFLFLAPNVFADHYDEQHNRNQYNSDAPHAGQVDTDGILSPGEIKNPHIDYDHTQRWHEQHGDDRVDNRYNDAAADREREEKIWRNRDRHIFWDARNNQWRDDPYNR